MSTKAEKNQKVEEIKEKFAQAKVAIVSDYRGLSVTEITNLRRKLQEEKGDYTVIKNTLAKIAIKDSEFEGLGEFLEGPSAIAFGFEDEVAPAKVLTKFKKDSKKTEIKGGVLEGKVLDVNEISEISELPSRDELLAKIVGGINGPATGIANCVNGVASSLVRAMEEIRKQKEAQG